MPDSEAFDAPDALVRLNKYLADRGVASRRKCDELIARGKVWVDGVAVTQLGTKVDPATARIEIEGETLAPQDAVKRYYLLNKPKGVVCTNDEREARPRAIDLIEDPRKGRIYTVGRLDEESHGLILLTNDGDWANLIAHPRHGVPKTYWAKIRGRVEGETIERLRKGVFLAEGRTSGAEIRVEKRTHEFTALTITLREGKNREVRRMFAKEGFKVSQLRRTRVGNLTARYLREGDWRPLTRAEVDDLRKIALGEAEVDPLGPGRRPHRKGFSHRRPIRRGVRTGAPKPRAQARERSTKPRRGPGRGDARR